MIRNRILATTIALVIILSGCTVPTTDNQQVFYTTQTPLPTIASKTDTPEPTQVKTCNIKSLIKDDWNTILCETYDNNDRQWWTGLSSDGAVKVDIRDGKYVVEYDSKIVESYSKGFQKSLKIGEAKDYVVSLDGKMISNYKSCLWGLVVRGIGDGFAFAIDNQRTYYLTFNGAKTNKYIGNLKSKQNSAIKWGDINTITAVAEGEKMVFYVNGEQVVSYDANNSTSKDISWTVWGSGGVDVIYEFDNLIIKEKPNGSELPS